MLLLCSPINGIDGFVGYRAAKTRLRIRLKLHCISLVRTHCIQSEPISLGIVHNIPLFSATDLQTQSWGRGTMIRLFICELTNNP